MKNRSGLYVSAAFILLFMVSLYRKFSLLLFENHSLLPFMVYGCYTLLIALWYYSVRKRFTQRHMIFFLSGEILVLFSWVTVRFLQDSLFYKDLHLMRVSGYLIVFPLVLSTLMGFYASLGLGRTGDFRLPPKYYLLFIPDILLILLMLTNEKTEFVFRLSNKAENYLEFKSNFGLIPIVLWASLMIVMRIVIIYKRSLPLKAPRWKKILPLILGLGMPLAAIPYFFDGFTGRYEIIELSAKFYFLEALSWESCIILGMVPVNTRYSEVFENSTVNMQILDRRGRQVLAGGQASELSGEEFSNLLDQHFLRHEGEEVRLHSISSGYLVYRVDISRLLDIINELNETNEELTNEQYILNRAVRAKNEKTKTALRNAIYNTISKEVAAPLENMKTLLLGITDENLEENFRKIVITGTYIKRYCNLRLIMEQYGYLDMEELRYSLMDFVQSFEAVGIETSLSFEPQRVFDEEKIIASVNLLERAMEENDFSLTAVKITVAEDFRADLLTREGSLLSYTVEVPET